jgi:signal transduction histidine kinase
VSASRTYESDSRERASTGAHGPQPPALQAIEWSIAIAVMSGVLALAVLRDGWQGVPAGKVLLWTAVVMTLDLLPIRLWHGLVLSLSLPVLLAAGFLYPVEVAAAIAFVGSTDIRELRRKVSLAHALFNRSQVALSTAAASAVFHLLDTSLSSWPLVLGVAMLALAADVLVNWTLVYVALRTFEQASAQTFLRNLSAGNPVSFLSAYVSFGLVAVLLALAVDVGGTWGLIAVGIPVLLARQVFVRSTELRDTALLLAEKSRMLLALTERIADERRDERLAIASGLHDDLLPPLYKVHLLGQVIRQDLARGQLLALDEDVPDLVSATEYASVTARSLIRRLRASPLGTDGLAATLKLFVRALAAEGPTRLHAEINAIGGAPVIELLAYHVAREALRNAVKHSMAKNVWIRLDREGDEMRLMVEDDGAGFQPDLVDENLHFGLQLIRERVELAGGVLVVDSAPGAGTRIVVRLPRELQG